MEPYAEIEASPEWKKAQANFSSTASRLAEALKGLDPIVHELDQAFDAAKRAAKLRAGVRGRRAHPEFVLRGFDHSHALPEGTSRAALDKIAALVNWTEPE